LIEIHRFEHHMLLLMQHVWTLDQMAEVEAWPSFNSIAQARLDLGTVDGVSVEGR
jgi:hypothetical protein